MPGAGLPDRRRPPTPRPDEVGEWAWWTWSRFLAAAADPDSGLSPWARLQAPLLDARTVRGRAIAPNSRSDPDPGPQ